MGELLQNEIIDKLHESFNIDDTYGSGAFGFDFSVSLSLSSDTSRSVTLLSSRNNDKLLVISSRVKALDLRGRFNGSLLLLWRLCCWWRR